MSTEQKEYPKNQKEKLKLKQEIFDSDLIIKTFDELGFESIVETYVGKAGSHVKVASGQLAKALVVKLMTAPSQSLYSSSRYFSNVPIDKLFVSNIVAKDFNRFAFSTFLDAVDAVGSDKLFVRCVKTACEFF